MDQILNIFKAPFVATPDPTVTVRDVAIVYGLTAAVIAIIIAK